MKKKWESLNATNNLYGDCTRLSRHSGGPVSGTSNTRCSLNIDSIHYPRAVAILLNPSLNSFAPQLAVSVTRPSVPLRPIHSTDIYSVIPKGGGANKEEVFQQLHEFTTFHCQGIGK